MIGLTNAWMCRNNHLLKVPILNFMAAFSWTLIVERVSNNVVLLHSFTTLNFYERRRGRAGVNVNAYLYVCLKSVSRPRYSALGQYLTTNDEITATTSDMASRFLTNIFLTSIPMVPLFNFMSMLISNRSYKREKGLMTS